MMKYRLYINKVFFFIFFMAIFSISALQFSCKGNGSQKEPDDGPTYGEKTIGIDECFKLAFDKLIPAFESDYVRAKITPKYFTEIDAINAFLNDSIEVIVISRVLTPEETAILAKHNIKPIVSKLAYEGVALIASKEHKEKEISYEQFDKILAGEITNWKQIHPESRSSEIQLLFDKNNSGTIKFLVSKFGKEKFMSLNSASAESNEGIIESVQKNYNQMGVIGTSWVLDPKDTTNQTFNDKIKVLQVSPIDTATGGGDYYKPYQAYIAKKYYPIIKTVYAINRESRAGLGSGFVAYIHNYLGQKIFMKVGYVTASQNVRIKE